MTNGGFDNSCQVTNNTGKAVVVLDAFNSATNVTNNAPQKGYQQTLKLLPLQQGGDIIADGAIGTVTLDDTRVDEDGQTEPNYLYQLLISEPQSLFPVMNVGEAVTFGTVMSYPPITVTAAAAANMQLGFSFCQNIMAFPGSSLATGFVQAMNTAQQQPTTTAMMQTMADYFNSTKGFQGLDFPSYLAVSTYLQAFSWSWALDSSGTPGRTYWLYASSDVDQPNGNTSNPNQGSIAFTLRSDAPNPADPTDPSSGFDILFTPANGDPLPLYFSNGQLVNSLDEDVPSICLQGSYALKSTFTQVESDTVLWPIFVGNVGGTTVIGVSQKPEDAFVSWLQSLVPTSFSDLVNSFLKIMGVVMAIDFIKTKLSGKKDKLDDDKTNENQGQDPNAEQQQEADQAADIVAENDLQLQQQNADRMGNDPEGDPMIEIPDEQDLPQAMQEANAEYVDAVDQVIGDKYQGSINEYDEQIQQLAEIEVNPQLEDAMGSLVDANNSLVEARQSGDFSEVNANLGDVQSSINLSMQEMNVPGGIEQQIAESQAIADEYESTAEDLEKSNDAVEGGEEEFEPELDI